MLKRRVIASAPKQSFNYKAQQAALLESANILTTSKASTIQATQPPSEVSNRSFVIFKFNETDHNNVQTHFIESDNPGSPHHVIHTSDNPSDFMRTSPNSLPLNEMDISTPDGENDQADPPLISIIPASNAQIHRAISGEKDKIGTNRDSIVKSTAKIDKTVNKIRSAQGKPISSTPLPQLCASQPMEQPPPGTKRLRKSFTSIPLIRHKTQKVYRKSKCRPIQNPIRRHTTVLTAPRCTEPCRPPREMTQSPI